MKEKINVAEYAQAMTEGLDRGALLCTNGDKFNAMAIGWGALGRCWSVPTYTVYVRRSRYTKGQLDKTGEFTVSFPLDGGDAEIMRVCGSLSGRDTDKAAEAGLKLEAPETNGVPGVAQYPLTLECRVLYSREIELSGLPEDIVQSKYPQDAGNDPLFSGRPHTEYIGQITAAYIIR